MKNKTKKKKIKVRVKPNSSYSVTIGNGGSTHKSVIINGYQDETDIVPTPSYYPTWTVPPGVTHVIIKGCGGGGGGGNSSK